MRKTLLISTFLLLFLFSFNLFGEEENEKTTTDGPKHYFTETEFDFGRLPPKSAVSHVYWVKNVGTDTLRILNVRPG